MTRIAELYANFEETPERKIFSNKLYRQMNGIPLREILYPVCILCRDHEKAGFVDRIKQEELDSPSRSIVFSKYT